MPIPIVQARSRWRGMHLLIVFIMVMVVSLPAGALPTHAAPSDISERYVIFLDGINSSSDGVTPLNGDFDTIEAHLRSLGITRFIYFSYGAAKFGAYAYCMGWGSLACEPKPLIQGPMDLVNFGMAPSYTDDQTHRPIHQQADVLEWLIGQIVLQDPSAQIDLVSFSLGGVVATYWGAHSGGTSIYRPNVHSITLIESPVGGIALAGAALGDCGISIYCPALQFFFGRDILRQLQIPADAPGSIIGTLPQAALNFPVMSIQSSADYLVNGESFPVCDPTCLLYHDSAPIGQGTQNWPGTSQTIHWDQDLGGDGLASSPIPAQDIKARILNNHNQPLKHGQTAAWVGEALQATTAPPATPADLAARYIILLDGINSSASADTPPLDADYSFIEARLREAGLSRFVYFSYSALQHGAGAYCLGWGPLGCAPGTSDLGSLSGGPVYVDSDTHQPIDQQAAVLDWLIGQIVQRDPNAQIDLVGYSLGGVVASYWGAQFGGASIYRSNIHGIVLTESPVGGIPLADAVSGGCGIQLICPILRGIYGADVLRQLQMTPNAPGSIVGALPQAARNFRLTAIQSSADYLVNSEPFRVCDPTCLLFRDSTPVGQGTQYWVASRRILHMEQDLGGDGLTSEPLSILFAKGRLINNHHAPLLHPQTAAWILEALRSAWDARPAHASIALIIDSSGSMGQNDPRDLRKWAGKFFIDLALPGDRIAVVDFDSGAYVRSALRTIDSQADRDTLKAAVDLVDSQGGTNLGAGLQSGYDQLTADASNNAKAAIFLTDGRQDALEPYRNQHLLYKAQGWPIYTIGLGAGVDVDLLRQIASNTSGKDYPAADSSALHEIYRTLSSRFQNQAPIDTTTFLAFQDQTKMMSATIPAGAPQVTFSTSWPGSDVSMTLLTPSGVPIDASTADPHVYHAKGSTYEVYRVDAPEAGAWQIAIRGVQIEPGGEPVTFDTAIGATASSAKANLALQLAADRDTAMPGDLVHYRIVATNTGPATATDVSIQSILPPALSFMALDCSPGSTVNGSLCSYPAVEAGATVSATLTAQAWGAPRAISATTTAVVSTSAIDPQNADNTASVDLNLPQTADLALTLVADRAEAHPEEQIVYTIGVTNNGPQTATGVTVQATLPDQLNFVTLTCDRGVNAGGSFCEYPSIEAGATVTSTLVAVPYGAPYFLADTRADVTSALFDPAPANNSATITTTLLPGSGIAFISNRDGNDEVYTMQPDGSNQQRLTNTPAAEGWPGFSPDGRMIVFWSTRDGNKEIYKASVDGSALQRLTFNATADEAPAWSPDSQQVVLTSNRDGNNEIYVMSADGSNLRRLTFNNADDSAPVWSPDGQLIAFRSLRDGNNEIYTMSADGSNPQRLTFNRVDDSAPAWSPDGQLIAFHSQRDGNSEIYVMNADGSNPRRLTTSARDDQTPSWSPDGRQIAFMSTRDGNREIYVMEADGANQQRLTFTTANEHSPGWWSR